MVLRRFLGYCYNDMLIYRNTNGYKFHMFLEFLESLGIKSIEQRYIKGEFMVWFIPDKYRKYRYEDYIQVVISDFEKWLTKYEQDIR